MCPPRPRPCSCCVRQDCGEREVPSSDDNSGHHWASICKVVETGSCASDDDCTGSRHCTRSTNPDEDFVCSGDSGCEQVCLSLQLFMPVCVLPSHPTTAPPIPLPGMPQPMRLAPSAPDVCSCRVRQDWTSTTVVISLEPSDSTAVCVDIDYGAVDQDPYNDACADYYGNTHWCGAYDDDDFTSNTMCCACGGGNQSAAPTQCLAEAGSANGNSWRCGAHVMQTCPEGRCCSRWGWCDFSQTLPASPPLPPPFPSPFPLPKPQPLRLPVPR